MASPATEACLAIFFQSLAVKDGEKFETFWMAPAEPDDEAGVALAAIGASTRAEEIDIAMDARRNLGVCTRVSPWEMSRIVLDHRMDYPNLL